MISYTILDYDSLIPWASGIVSTVALLMQSVERVGGNAEDAVRSTLECKVIVQVLCAMEPPVGLVHCH